MSDLIKYTSIGGTSDWQRGKWFWCKDPKTGERPLFAVWMASEGFQCVRRNGPFWSGLLSGVPFMKRKAWQFGASVLKEWMEEHLAPEERNIISVSHGGQPAFMAAADGLKLNSLTCITMPQRHDMEDVYRAAMPNIGTFTNVYSDSWWRDRWQILGTLTDGELRFRRTFKLDGIKGIVNIGIKGVGHTDLVRTSQMTLLKTNGVLARIG